MLLFIAAWPGIYISRAPNITETIFWLGTDSLLIGRTSFCDFPEDARQIPVAGSFTGMNFETVIELNPDSVLFSGNMTSKDELFLLQNKIGISNIEMDDIYSVFSGMSQLARITGSERDIDSFKYDAMHLINMLHADSSACDIYIEVGTAPTVSAGRESYIGSILEALGYHVIDFGRDYVPVSQEAVINADPDIIIIMSKGNDPSERSGWGEVKAVRKNSIIILEENEIDILSRPGPRLTEAIRILGAYLNETDI